MAKGRVLVLTSNFPRWPDDSTTPFVLHLCRNLQENGWQVDVLAPHAPGAAHNESIDGVRVNRFQYLWPCSWQTVCYQGGAMGNLRKNKLNYLKLPFLLFSEWLAVWRRLLTGKYDLLHSHWILPQGFVGRLASFPLSIPHVITVHGGDVFGLRGRLMARAKRFALQGADRITVNSSVTEMAVRSLVPKGVSIDRIPMGVKISNADDMTDNVNELRALYNRDNVPLLVFVGRVVEEKGVADFLTAVAMLLDASLEVRALIVGEGQDRASMEQLASDLGIGGSVDFVGWQPSELIPYYLAAADIFIGPSRTAENGWVEAQGLTFIEAMMAGTPVVASRVGGIIDSVIHRQTGLLVDERSPHQIFDAVKSILFDKILAVRLSENGRKMAVDKFSEEASIAAFDQLFTEVLQCRS